MPRPLRYHTVTVTLAHPDYEIFLAAVRILARVMRKEAPDLPALVHSKLQWHDAAGLAEDYLDLVRWPVTRRKALQAPRKVRQLRRDERAERLMTGKARPPRNMGHN